MKATSFKSGDVVIHPRRREWGPGVVEQARNVVHKGCGAQRLTVTFLHRGRLTINTGVAPLIAAGMEQTMSSASTPQTQLRSGEGWIGSLEQGASANPLSGLPESTTDPFASLQNRMEATLASFRFSKEPRSLIDWAITQTGAEDPLTTHTRQELELAFETFARARNQHLKDLVRQAKQQRLLAYLNELLDTTTLPMARTALNSAMRC